LSWLYNPKEKHTIEEISNKILRFPVPNNKHGSLESRAEYQSAAAVTLFKSFPILKKRLSDRLIEIYEKLEKPFIGTLAKMEYQGIHVDRNKLKELDKKLEEEISSLEEKIKNYANYDFNINSPEQLSGFLFDYLELPKTKTTNTGHCSTTKEELLKIENKHPVISLILQYKDVYTPKTKATTPLLEKANRSFLPIVYSNFDHCGTVT
ncbi:MAG: DNA polymerase, partial [Campylobacterales bacterium]|nr:DNA polymerase [Campylobacterales bacterium]